MFIKLSPKKDKAFFYSIFTIILGFLLPIFIGIITTIIEAPKCFFLKILFSNCVIVSIFCLPISIGIMFFSIPLYNYLNHITNCGIENAEKPKIVHHNFFCKKKVA